MTRIDRVPAAQYLRMSTEDQQYSIENQKDAIRDYAEESGYSIVATYTDSGKSGVSIKNRSGLRNLLQDVMNGHATFKAILVYDVSRWGRFQDTDEAAHYEFLCRDAGIPIRYCAEQFENDGSMPSSVMKALKRTMAAEYSRELGVKVYRGQRRLVLLGFRAGGIPAYGVRRMLVGTDGRRKQILKANERKSIKSERVILVPGPRQEVENVRKIFSMGVLKRNTPRRISAELGRQGLTFADGRPWNEQMVFRVLNNPVYAGRNTWGRTTKPLGGRTSRVPPDAWVTKSEAFRAIVDQASFDRVQRVIQSRKTTPKRPDEYLLRGMRRVLAREGRLTERLLKGRHIFDYRTYCKRFGSVLQAYRLIGYQPSAHALKSMEHQVKVKRLRTNLLQSLKELFPEHVRIIHQPGQVQREVVELDRRLRIAVHLCCPVRITSSGPRWILRAQRLENGLPALICTVDSTLATLLNYYLVPPIGGAISRYKVFGDDHPWLADGRRLRGLTQFYEIANEVAAWWTGKEASTVVGDVVLTKYTSTVTIARKEITLPRLDAAIFELLVLNAGRVVSRARLSHPLPGITLRYLNAHMYELRNKLGRFGERIQTVPGVGYVYAPENGSQQSEQASNRSSLKQGQHPTGLVCPTSAASNVFKTLDQQHLGQLDKNH